MTWTLPTKSSFKRQAGVWVVYYHDWGIRAQRVYADELEARREAEHWEQVAFWPFGEDLQKVKVYGEDT